MYVKDTVAEKEGVVYTFHSFGITICTNMEMHFGDASLRWHNPKFAWQPVLKSLSVIVRPFFFNVPLFLWYLLLWYTTGNSEDLSNFPLTFF